MNLKRLGMWFGLVLLAVVGLALVVSYVFYPVDYVNRVLRWGDADVFDYLKFPERRVSPSGEPYIFPEDERREEIERAIANEERLAGFQELIEGSGTQALIMLQDGQVVYEQYFNGYTRESIVTSFSVAKSFASTLVGIAINEGHIGSVDDAITEYLPELVERDARFVGITIKDLLLMSSGIRYQEFPFVNGDDAKTYYFPDLRSLALEETVIVGDSGEFFHYNNFHPLLLGMILERATGMTVAQYLESRIWQPMGAEFEASWSLDERGFEKMESGINGRAIDFAKFGQLFLEEGSFNGAQIVPQEWVSEATAPLAVDDYRSYYYDDFIFSDGSGFYKYMWWGIENEGGGHDFMALGNHGQLIYISPDRDSVIVRFGESYGSAGGELGWIESIRLILQIL